jgi:hypothetical protein
MPSMLTYVLTFLGILVLLLPGIFLDNNTPTEDDTEEKD